MRKNTSTELARHDVANATAAEHADLTDALMRFEAALASPSYKRRRLWRKRVAQELEQLLSTARTHRASSEGAGGLYDELVLRLGTTPEIRRGRLDHERIEHSTAELLASLRRRSVPSAEEQPRRDAETLTRIVRRHQALEAELLLEAINRDIGVGD